MPEPQREKTSDPYSQEAAERLIHTGQHGKLLENLEKYRIEDPFRIAEAVLKKDRGSFTFKWIPEISRLGIGVEDLQSMLIRNNEISSVLNRQDHFPDPNYDEITGQIFSSGKNLEEIFLKWNRFSKNLLPETYIDQLFQHRKHYLIFNFISEHPEIDRHDLLARFKDEGLYDEILENIHYFPDINLNDFTAEIINSHKAFVCLGSLKNVESKYHSPVLKAAIKDKPDTWLAGNLSEIWNVDIEDIRQMDPEHFSFYDWKHFFNRLPCFNLSPADIQETVAVLEKKRPDLLPEIIQELWVQHYYENLLAILPSSTQMSEIFASQRLELNDLQGRLDYLVSRGCLEHVEKVIKLSQYLGIKLDTSKVVAPPEETKEKRERYGTVSLVHDICLFYLAEHLNAQIYDISKRLEGGITADKRELLPGLQRPRHLEFSRLQDRIAFKQIESGVHHSVDPFVNFVKEYLLVACDHELDNQNESGYNRVDNVGYTYYLSGSREQIKGFFLRTAEAFDRPRNFSGSRGGKKWAVIAEAGLDLWSAGNKPKEVYLVDKIISLEHHTGHIFDKNYQRINYDRDTLINLLNFRKGSTDFSELLDFALANGILEESEIKWLQQSNQELKALSDFNRTPVRAELSD